eukprot:TRINITY_DN3655_c0_g2_i1.p1 TRINITY_DN3655_c0_g2~~TRINITY_DN3655_c0_g2_i1.p1  ORF type:complete len:283 (+),score=49.62 TRINITY_DN3655_c0_g2_i1:42-890(+)
MADDEEYKEEPEIVKHKKHKETTVEKWEQLNLLLDRAKLYSSFLGQQMNGDSLGEAKLVGENVTIKYPQPSNCTGGKLRHYQLEGLNWLIQLFENGINGILADEMGLGKTIITLSFLAHLWSKGVLGPFLIVAPVSTLSNWKSELAKWCPEIPYLLYYGKKEERKEMREKLVASRKSNRSKGLPVVITSYNIAINDRKSLQVFKWKYLVVDEAHRLKNFNCKLIKELRVLYTDNRLLLTGTPLQNNLSELWSLLNFILPDIFDSVENFQSWYNGPMLSLIHI